MSGIDHELVNTDIAMPACTGKFVGWVVGSHNFHRALESREMVSEDLNFECSVKELQKPYFALFGHSAPFQWLEECSEGPKSAFPLLGLLNTELLA